MQFNLRSLIVGMVTVSMYFGLVFAVPFIIAGPMLMLITVFIPVAVVCGMVYDRGRDQAFWIGCAAGGLAPWAACMGIGASSLFSGVTIFEAARSKGQAVLLLVSIFHGVIVLCGLLGIAFRRSSLRNQVQEEIDK